MYVCGGKRNGIYLQNAQNQHYLIYLLLAFIALYNAPIWVIELIEKC